MPTDLFRSERDRNLESLAGQVRSLWLRLSLGRRLVAAGVLVGLAGAIAWTALAPPDPEWVLATKIPEERQALVAAALLNDAGVPLRRKGAELLVPPDHLATAQRLLAANPEALAPAHAAGGWEQLLGQASTPKAQLERELADSLMRVTAVQAARVHLSLGRKSPFRDRAAPPAASVLLHLRDGVELTPAQVDGIRELVASGIEGASPKAITVLDQQGRSLAATEPTPQQERAALEAECNAKVRAVLEPLLGSGRVISVATIEPATASSAARTRVAVLVDPEPRGEDYEERLERWTQLARDAAGLDEARGDTLTLELAAFTPAAPSTSMSTSTSAPLAAPKAAPPLASSTPTSPRPALEPDWRLLSLAASALALLLALVAGVAWRRVRRYRRQLTLRAAALPAPVGSHPLEPGPPRSRLDLELARAARVLGADPEATALVLSTWLTAGSQEPARAPRPAHTPEATP